MSVTDDTLTANATIAKNYDSGRAKPPTPRIAIVTCMDPRLTNIGQMLGLADGDADIIRNAGTVIDDDAIRSLVVSTRLLGSKEIMIINHTDCGMLKFTDSDLEDRLVKETGQILLHGLLGLRVERARGLVETTSDRIASSSMTVPAFLMMSASPSDRPSICPMLVSRGSMQVTMAIRGVGGFPRPES